jgi:hypothetical protein
MKVMRVLGLVIVLVAVVAGVVPVLNNCSAGGKMLTLTTGRQVPMKCYWTAQASIAVALPLGVLGLALAFSRRKETRRALALVAAALGVALMLLPTYLIGTCASWEMVCNLVLKPTMLGLGILTIALAGVAWYLSRGDEPEAAE